MSLFSLLAFTVYAAETVISPLPDTVVTLATNDVKPAVSFGELSKISSLSAVLGESAVVTPSPTPTPRPTRKRNYTIAVLGDSMTDTLGPGIPDLSQELSKFYPGVKFTLLSYGVGGTNIEYGLTRLTNNYTYLGRQIPSLVSQNPDVVVIESFGYNPIPNEPTAGGLDRHWLDLSHVVDTLRSQLPAAKIVVAATIAPDAKTFGDGAAGLSFSPVAKAALTATIKSYLENAVKFAQSQHLHLADAYHASLDGQGNGLEAYINQGDHIHPSSAGRALFAQKVAAAIVGNRLLE